MEPYEKALNDRYSLPKVKPPPEPAAAPAPDEPGRRRRSVVARLLWTVILAVFALGALVWWVMSETEPRNVPVPPGPRIQAGKDTPAPPAPTATKPVQTAQKPVTPEPPKPVQTVQKPQAPQPPVKPAPAAQKPATPAASPPPVQTTQKPPAPPEPAKPVQTVQKPAPPPEPVKPAQTVQKPVPAPAPPVVTSPPATNQQVVIVPPAPSAQTATPVTPVVAPPPAQTVRETPAPAAPEMTAEQRAMAGHLVERARSRLAARDVVGARLYLERAMRAGDGRASFLLAETYDPGQMYRWDVRGLRPDSARARQYYRLAAERGINDGAARADALPQ